MTSTIETIKSHRTIRKFQPVEMSSDVVRRSVATAQMASSSSNVQAYSCLWVKDPEKRAALVELTGGQPQVAEAGGFFVISGDQRRHETILQRANKPYCPNLESFLLCAIDATLFAQNLALSFESLGFGICFIGGLREALPRIDQLLDIPHGIIPFYGLCVGQPAADPGPRPRLPLDAILFEDRYPTKADVEAGVADYDATMAAYYGERGKPDHNWSGGIVRKFSQPHRADLAEYYRSKGARLE